MKIICSYFTDKLHVERSHANRSHTVTASEFLQVSMGILRKYFAKFLIDGKEGLKDVLCKHCFTASTMLIALLL